MLAVKLMIEQGIEVEALNFTSAFCTCEGSSKKKESVEAAKKSNGNESANTEATASGCKGQARLVAERFGVPIKVMSKGADYTEIIRNPKYGYGKGINPCVDCRIYMFHAAKKYMEECGASFIITGEVIGQRPMSQRRPCFKTIEEESGLEGLILRPLCAKNLDPTIPEKEGLVDRDKLMDITGRSRRGQMDMAEELDIGDYPCPSGGCLLTDKIFSKKVRDLLDHNDDVTTTDLQLLKYGRHFRFEGAKVVVGKDEFENTRLRNLVKSGDTLLEPKDFTGPNAIITGAADDRIKATTDFACGVILRYAATKADGTERLIKATCDGVTEELRGGDALDPDVVEERNVC